MKILGIDPSVNNVGIALYDTVTKELRMQNFHPRREPKMSHSRLTVQIARVIHIEFLQGEKPDAMVLEFPQWEDSERGWVAMKQGHILNLAFIVGYLSASFDLPASKVFTPTVKEWKGNMPKTAVEERFRLRFPDLEDTKVSDHEFEATMLICWLLDNPDVEL